MFVELQDVQMDRYSMVLFKVFSLMELRLHKDLHENVLKMIENYRKKMYIYYILYTKETYRRDRS